MTQSLTILGATGSIGKNTLDVVARHTEKYHVFALTAHSNHQLLLQQCLDFQPKYAVMVDPDSAEKLRMALNNHGSQTDVLNEKDALSFVARQADIVMAGIVGAAGLLPTLAAVEAGKRVLLANKEPLVMAGQLFFDAAKQSGAKLIPVDSEHNAIFQCLPAGYETGNRPTGVKKLVLTASGGPFRDTPLADLKNVTCDQAVAHPNWKMGAKISVDCATMLNKGLEVIEAHWLFNIPLDQIEVIVHPQSIIHSIVAYEDGSMLAQLGDHDMRIPISSALAWPERIASGVDALDFTQISTLGFQPIDYKRYPCLSLAYQAMKSGPGASVILNAANEIAVAEFLKNHIGFLDISTIIEYCLTKLGSPEVSDLQSILALDTKTRELAMRSYPQIVSSKMAETS